MTYLRGRWTWWHVLVGLNVAIVLFGCSPPPRQGARRELQVVPAEPEETAAQSERITLSLEFRPGTKTRYRVTTEAVTIVEDAEVAIGGNFSPAPLARISEAIEVVFTREILELASEDPNTVAALITIDQVKYSRKSPEQADLAFDSREPIHQSSPFARLIGQTYTIGQRSTSARTATKWRQVSAGNSR